MRIGIDARWIFPEISGIGTYTQELIRHLARVDAEHEFILFFDHDEVMERTMGLEEVAESSRFSARRVDASPNTIKSQLKMPWIIRRARLDLFHSTNYMIPVWAFPRGRTGRTRCVVTIHDLIPLMYPDHTPKSKKRKYFPLFKRLLLETGARADRIITVSESSRRDIIEHLEIPDGAHDKIVVIPEGVGERFCPGPSSSDRIRTILYVGRFDPYKNVVRLVESFKRVHEKLPATRLRVIGSPDPRYPEAMNRASVLNLNPHIEWQGYVSDEELVKAYQQASVLVLPSQYEGFGLPVLEAMASGTPVVCSNVSSLPEVAGSAALLVNPTRTSDLAEAILRVLIDTGLAMELREKGLARAAEFTWLKTVQQTLQVYEQALAGNLKSETGNLSKRKPQVS